MLLPIASSSARFMGKSNQAQNEKARHKVARSFQVGVDRPYSWTSFSCYSGVLLLFFDHVQHGDHDDAVENVSD